jgi:glycolate oxidase FAD binding subunit
VLIRVATRPSALADVLRATEDAAATLVGRVTVGHSFVDLDPEAIEALHEHLPDGAVSVLLDAPASIRESLDPWGLAPGEAALALMQRVKARFDPANVCSPGVFVGGI